ILIKNGVKYEKYRIDKNFKPIFNKKLHENEYIYIVNYYGQISNSILYELKNIYKNIIVDNTHAFFQKPIEKVDTIYSCRKFFGVPDGAYLISELSNLNFDLEVDISKTRMKHILGRYEGNASDYYNEFKICDEKFSCYEMKKMSKLTHNIMGAIDYSKIKKVRDDNFLFLHNSLKKYNKLDVKMPYGAFSYPLYVEDSERVRRELIKNKIYVAILWGNVLEENNSDSIEYMYAKNIIPLPCDQRYNIEDMDFVVNILKKLMLN
ncbi:hypothetical protein, partial [Clostridium perfringens]|uniref:hypothetical protein n=1 Tax=Clostridium perfringens TaxID=1502 RepID=UPI0039EA88F8